MCLPPGAALGHGPVAGHLAAAQNLGETPPEVARHESVDNGVDATGNHRIKLN